jgi:hypothetical protein
MSRTAHQLRNSGVEQICSNRHRCTNSKPDDQQWRHQSSSSHTGKADQKSDNSGAARNEKIKIHTLTMAQNTFMVNSW